MLNATRIFEATITRLAGLAYGQNHFARLMPVKAGAAPVSVKIELTEMPFMEAWLAKPFQELRLANLDCDVTGRACEKCIAYADHDINAPRPGMVSEPAL